MYIYTYYLVVTTGSTTIMTTKATNTIIDGLTTSTILPTSTMSNTNILDNKGTVRFL